MSKERVMPKTGCVVIPKGRDSSSTKKVEIGSGKKSGGKSKGY